MGDKLNYPSAERNKSFILQVLQTHFSSSQRGNVLEIASGSGQHAFYFAKHFPNLSFQPTEFKEDLFKSIQAYADDAPNKNMKSPLKLDVASDPNTWHLPFDEWDYIININMIHISAWDCTIGLFKAAGRLLRPAGLMAMYGPYAKNGVITPQSNIDFDASLKMNNPEWGLRDISDLQRLASEQHLALIAECDLPSNNKCLIWRRN